MGDTDDDFLEDLKSLGLEGVSHQRAQSAYGERKLAIVNYWIESQERKLSEEASERGLSLRCEEIDIARSAKKAATRAATAAIIAAIAASVGIIISATSLVLSVS